MSDYRDILLKALQEGKTMDSCGLDERYYDFGLYTDLCGMSVEDAIKSVTQCCCGGGGSNTGGTKTNNPITISAEKNTDNKYVVKVKAVYATTAPVIVSFTIDGQSVTATIPAGASEATVDGVVLDTQYATIGKIEIATTDEVYKYTAVSSIADGLFVLTYKIDGKTVHELTIKVGTKIEKFEPEAKTGYLFKGWVPAEPETMPEKDTTLEGTYEAIPYYIVFKDETTGDIRVECFYQGEIKKPDASEKKGHDFQGWFMADGNEVPDVLDFIPDGDVEATPKYEPKTYTLTYQTYDGQEWKTASIKYDTVIVYETDGPARVGYDFTGWGNKPENDRMPDSDVILKALYEIHRWNLIYSLADDENPDFTGVTFENVEYNAEITEKTTTFAEEHKTDEGKYVFSWDGTEHETTNMPDSNLTIKAIRKVVEHTLKFVDAEGTVYSSITQNYGTAVNLTIEPKKEGYTFTGWDKGTIPTTMPAEDMTFISQFEINKHTVNFVMTNEKDVADTGITILNVAYGTELAAIMDGFKQKYPNVEGEYQFSWINEESIPTTMPDENVTISAKYEAIEHTLTFMSDGKEYETKKVAYGAAITAPTVAPTKTGYTFKQWIGVPETMPAQDVVIEAEFTINSYSLTFKNGADVVTAFTVEYGATLADYPSRAMALVPAKDGYTFSWDSAVPATMPAEDVVVEGSYKEAKNLAYHGMIKEQDFGTLTQEMVSAFASSDIAENITFTIPADEEYIKRFNIVQFGGESEEEEQEAAAWMREHEKNNTYSFIIAIPSKYANVKFTYVQMDAVINDFVKEANTVMNIGGIEYALWVAHHEMKEENNPYAPRTDEYKETYKLTF